jgi:hypothetical protein
MSDEMQAYCKKLYETKESVDLVITFNSIPYHVHSLVLGMTSKYFENLFIFKEKGESMDFELDISYISQDAFEHYLKYCYFWELDMNYALPMLSLSSYFDCDKLWEACQRYRLHNVPFCENNALHFFQYIISKFTLDETKEVIKDKLLVDCVVWFTLHFDKILELKLETLKLIPLEWLRYVFGKAVFHVFESELDRLQKARQLYFKLGESKELFSALFEGIRFNCITFLEMCDENLLFLYQSDNDVVLDKLQIPRISDMSGMYNLAFLKDSPSLVMKLSSKDSEEASIYSLAENVRGTFRYRSGKHNDLTFDVFLLPEEKKLELFSVSIFFFSFEDNFERWYFSSEQFTPCKEYGSNRTTFLVKNFFRPCLNMHFRMNVLSLTIEKRIMQGKQ